MGNIEALYREYGDLVAFRLVYINEAHAIDGQRPQDFAREHSITEHDDLAERCLVADMMVDESDLTLPILVDEMDDRVRKAYDAWPSRIFIIGEDGSILHSGDPGPRGIRPSIRAVENWLADYSETARSSAAEEG